MFRRLWAKRRSILPVNVRFIVLGMVGGLITGFANLRMSVDVASTAGFVTFLSLSLGAWLGMHLVISMLTLAVAVTKGMADRADTLMKRLGIMPENPVVSSTLAHQLMRCIVVLTHALVPGWAFSLLYVLLGSQTPVVSITLMVWMAYSLTALLVLGLAVQWGYIGLLWRGLINLEHQVDYIETLESRVSADSYLRANYAVERARGYRSDRIRLAGALLSLSPLPPIRARAVS